MLPQIKHNIGKNKIIHKDRLTPNNPSSTNSPKIIHKYKLIPNTNLLALAELRVKNYSVCLHVSNCCLYTARCVRHADTHSPEVAGKYVDASDP